MDNSLVCHLSCQFLNEATKKQLQSARAEGDAVDKCVNWLVQNAADYGKMQTAGEYKVSWLCATLMTD
jgi:hypothetical protein